MIDTQYNEESFFVRHAYFTGGNDPLKRLKTAPLRALWSPTQLGGKTPRTRADHCRSSPAGAEQDMRLVPRRDVPLVDAAAIVVTSLGPGAGQPKAMLRLGDARVDGCGVR